MYGSLLTNIKPPIITHPASCQFFPDLYTHMHFLADSSFPKGLTTLCNDHEFPRESNNVDENGHQFSFYTRTITNYSNVRKLVGAFVRGWGASLVLCLRTFVQKKKKTPSPPLKISCVCVRSEATSKFLLCLFQRTVIADSNC